MNVEIPVIAGMISTIMFCASTLPMLKKAFQTRDLHSYSLGNLLIANCGNLVHSVYVFDLPPGPIWFLHGFHMTTTGLMLAGYLLYESRSSFSHRIAVRTSAAASSFAATSGDPTLQSSN